MTRSCTAFFALFFLAVAAAPALAANHTATQAVRKANEQITSLLRKQVEPGSPAEAELATRATRLARDFLDIDTLGRRALRDHWDQLTPDQRQRFLERLRHLIEAGYIEGLRANVEYQVTYRGERPRGDHVVVPTEVQTERRGRPYTVRIDYLMQRDRGRWRVVDMVTDGVGLVENYRAQFNRIIARHGFGGLLERMERRAEAPGLAR